MSNGTSKQHRYLIFDPESTSAEAQIASTISGGETLEERIKVPLQEHFDEEVENVVITEGKFPLFHVRFNFVGQPSEKTEYLNLIKTYDY